MLHCPECLFQVLENVINMLNANRQANRVWLDALLCLLLLVQLCVGCRVWMNDKRFRIRHICKQRKQFKVIYKRSGILLSALDFKGKDGPAAVWKIFFI